MSDKLFVVSEETGEIITTFNSRTHYLLRARASDDGHKRHLNKQSDKRYFSFADIQNVPEVIDKLNTVHLGYLLILQSYIDFDGKITLSRKQMPKALGTSDSTFQRFLSVIRAHGIITELNGEYYVNKRYHYRGAATSNGVIKLFTTQLRHVSHELQPSELGFLYKLLPYVHYDTNMICHDPAATEAEIHFLNKTKIAALVGMDRKQTYKTLDKLKQVGVVAETVREGNKRDHRYTLNPYIFFRKSGTPDETLRGLFAKTSYNK
jgi:hypothetical protein